MSETLSRLRNSRLIRQNTETHLFAVGQTVRLRHGFMAPASKSSGIYEITATLPPKGDSPQYRIRNEGERHERVTTQDSLEAVDPLQIDANTSLIDGTFGGSLGATPPEPATKKDATSGLIGTDAL